MPIYVKPCGDVDLHKREVFQKRIHAHNNNFPSSMFYTLLFSNEKACV